MKALLKVGYLCTIVSVIVILIIAFASPAGLATDDPVYDCSLRLNELLDSLFDIYEYYLFNRFFNVNCLNFCLGPHLIAALELGEYMLGLDYYMLIVF